MSQHNNGISLTNVPSDIIRKIIGMGLESFDSMRFITRRWNALAKERFKCRANINYFAANSPRKPGISACEYPIISEAITACNAGLFLKECFLAEGQELQCWTLSEGVFPGGLRKELDDLDMISDALGKVPIVNFVISDLLQIYDKYSALFLDFIKAHSVRYVQLRFDHMDWNTYAGGIKKFFNEAMPLVTSIEFNFREDARNQATLYNEWDARAKELVEKGNYSNNLRVRSAPVRPVRRRRGEYSVFLKIEQLPN